MQDTTQIAVQHDSVQPATHVDSDIVFVAQVPVKDTLQHSANSPVAEKVKQDSASAFHFSDSLNSDSTETILHSEQSINLFHGHELKKSHSSERLVNDSSPDWMFPVVVLALAILTWLRVFYSKYFNQILRAFFNNNLTDQIVRDENLLLQRTSIVLNIAFTLIMAMFLYIVSIRYNWAMSGVEKGLIRFVVFALSVSFVYTLKFIVLKISGYLFEMKREMAAYLFNIILINNILGIFLFPLVAVLAFGQMEQAMWLINASLIIIGAAYLYRLLRGILIGISVPGFSPVYLFLYLCTLEIAPFALLLKLVSKQ